jgi:hypothetical protein
MGYEITNSYYYVEKWPALNSIKGIIEYLFYQVPSFRPFQVVVGKKSDDARHEFWSTEANR